MDLDNNGQIFSLDLLLYVVLLTILIFLATYIYISFDNTSSETVFESLNDKYIDTMEDALFKTAGTPDNWHLLDDSQIATIGLCKDNDSYLISYDKLLRLKDNPSLIHTVLPAEYKCNFRFESVDNPNNKIIIMDTYTPKANENILTTSIPVIIDYGYDIYPIQSNKDKYNCPYNHLNNGDNWRCKSFNITKDNLDKSKYYIVSKDAKVILSNTYGENESFYISDYFDITDKFNDLIHQSEDTIYIHIHSSAEDNYLVCDKNNRQQHLNSVVTPEKYMALIELSM